MTTVLETTVPKLSRVVVKIREFAKLLFKHLLHPLRQYKLFHTLTKLLRNGVFVVFLWEGERKLATKCHESKVGYDMYAGRNSR